MSSSVLTEKSRLEIRLWRRVLRWTALALSLFQSACAIFKQASDKALIRQPGRRRTSDE